MKAATEFFDIGDVGVATPLTAIAKIPDSPFIDKWRAQISASLNLKNELKNSLTNAEANSDENSESQADENSNFIKLGKQTSAVVKDLISQSEKIERVTKVSIFEEEITEKEMGIIKQRVALQQKQFAEFEKREYAIKSKKILNVFEYLSKEEIETALKIAKNDEDEAIIQLSNPGFLHEIRKDIAHSYETKEVNDCMTEIQRYQYEELVKKRTRTQKKTTTNEVKRKYHTVGRLPLDKALEQLRQHTAESAKDPSKANSADLKNAMKGWSLARIKAYQAIDTKPNAYYYRFNAPGEVQRTGPWSEKEKKLFHDRLAEIGANGSWGIFSMVIPGRVGYQCSNYYRYLIQNNLIKDPNYVLDKNGKAHYLFSTKKKNADGTVVKEFRTHNKRGKKGPTKKRRAESTDESEGSFEVEIGSESDSSQQMSGRGTRKSLRRYGYSNDSSSDDEIRANDVELTSDEEFEVNLAIENEKLSKTRSHIASSDSGRSGSVEFGSSHRTKRKIVGASTSLVTGTSLGSDDRPAANSSTTCFDNLLSSSKNSDDDIEEDNYNPNNPLPDFLDPITLEIVTKPAISPYGHVMDYSSWVRCLMFPNEGGQKNICPLTKKPLHKRELVVLTFDNIEEYRSKIVNI
ncbi:hypothetical protein BB560_002097 [Smittium megazygosporum]|uniref:Myb-like domain-containing protein n=1 Tax=Smittium megazygosporum TaxID=133381 RepID=A0A2T9ZFR3_9FUNG|nr:hypothetical protein BB560_002097 [Smittium megazygosporum]